jgi:hypothetical protein
MEIVFDAELQVPQFEVVRIEHARSVNDSLVTSSFSLIFRAVPDNSGRGCALFIAPSIMVRNTTSLRVNWFMPEPANIDHLNSLIPTGEYRGGSISINFNETFSRPGVAKKSSSRSSSRVAPNRAAYVRWVPCAQQQQPPTPSRKSAVTFDAVSNRKADADAIDSSRHFQHLGPGQHVPLSLPWIIAASDESQVHNLTLSVPGSSESGQILPTDTLLNLGRFDFDKAHYSEEQRFNLGGSLITLDDEITGEPIHLCCTVTAVPIERTTARHWSALRRSPVLSNRTEGSNIWSG